MAGGFERPNILESSCALPSFQPDIQAPATSGGFLDTRFVSPDVIGHECYAPDLPETPVDIETGLPYCFVPNPEVQMVLDTGVGRSTQEVERQHQYPKVEVLYAANPLLQDHDAKQALLNLRWQLVTYNDHHYGYNLHYKGPWQPSTPAQLGVTIVMALSNFIPEVGLDFTGARPKERRMDEYDRRYLQESGQVHIGNEGDVLRYLFRHVLSQEVDHIRDREIDEFLHTFIPERKIYLGHCIAAKIVERAVEPVEGVYAKARRNGLLAPVDKSKRFVRPPQHPRDLVKAKLTSGRRFGQMVNSLHHRLGPNSIPPPEPRAA